MSDEVSTIIVVGEKEFDLNKKGREQAELVVSFSRWLGKHGVPALDSLSERDDLDDLGQLETLFGLLNELTTDALIDLYIAVFGCTKKFADEYFDIGDLVEAASIVWDTQPSIRRVISRFFSTSASEESLEDSSMTSEPPTDGQTTK